MLTFHIIRNNIFHENIITRKNNKGKVRKKWCFLGLFMLIIFSDIYLGNLNNFEFSSHFSISLWGSSQTRRFSVYVVTVCYYESV